MKIKMTYFLTLLLGLTVLTACGGNTNANVSARSNAAEAPSFDPTQPGNVVSRLFEAAKADDPKLLAGLCDPEKQNDGDTDCLCALDPAYVPHQCGEDSGNRISWEEFKEYFQNGSLAGEPTIAGNEAGVPFHFGSSGTESETMTLVKRGEKWYLSSF
ncbi:MAG: hypothetical protein IPN95_32065 [Bacteroidetes bacterium]|nr:hypothetical protein [Bacteroidota bacterium]MBL0015579.1 hypothetical protein [Bacteroidota bacterium]MBP6638899.1 hypothetical protein [Bacteroidia bacterium]